MPKIFISYRREDSQWPAQQIRDKLASHFGPEAVVFDVDSIPMGVDYRKYLANEVAQCDVLCAVIGKQWLSLLNERPDGSRDFVRIEIEAALQRKIPLIPVLIDDASIPGEKELPSDLADLAHRNAAEVSAGPHLQDNLNRLVAGLNQLLQSDAAPVATGIFLDPETNLMWSVKDNGKDIDWNRARAYATDLRLGGYDDWRLPTIEELEGLYDPNVSDPARDFIFKLAIHIKEPLKVTRLLVWSSTKKGPGAALAFNFGFGKRYSLPVGNSDFGALCVRVPDE